jgi:hypothetical protein
MVGFSFDFFCVGAVEAGEMHFQLILRFSADPAFPPDGSLINQLPDSSAHSHFVIDFPGLVNLQEIFPAAAWVTFFKSIFNKMSDDFNLMQ